MYLITEVLKQVATISEQVRIELAEIVIKKTIKRREEIL
jgi:hypothetical protein